MQLSASAQADGQFSEFPRSLRVLLYSAAAPNEAGGVQGVLRRLRASLDTRGHLAMQAWARSAPSTEQPIFSAPLRLRAPGAAPWAPLQAMGELSRHLRQRRPDVVNVHFITGQSIYFLLLGRALGFKTVLSAHGSDLLAPRPQLRPLLPWLLRCADAVTVVSAALEARARALGAPASRLHVTPNGVDLAFWSALPRQPAPEPRLLAAGRLERVKGFDLLLQAFAGVLHAVPAARLEIAGEGAERDRLGALAAELGVAHAVEFAGVLAPEALRARLASAHAFVLPSRSEGLPLALLEAMAAGVPIVASAVGAVAETLGRDEAGLLTPPERPEALTAALLRLLQSPTQAARLGAAAQARAQAFSAEASAQAFESLYRRLARRRG